MSRPDSQDYEIMQEPLFYSRYAYDAIGQYENWLNLLDMANAVKYGFSKYRLPKPGMPIDVHEAEERVTNIDREWAAEHRSRGKRYEKPSPDFSSCSTNEKCYLHSILTISEPCDEIDFPFYM